MINKKIEAARSYHQVKWRDDALFVQWGGVKANFEKFLRMKARDKRRYLCDLYIVDGGSLHSPPFDWMSDFVNGARLDYLSDNDFKKKHHKKTKDRSAKNDCEPVVFKSATFKKETVILTEEQKDQLIQTASIETINRFLKDSNNFNFSTDDLLRLKNKLIEQFDNTSNVNTIYTKNIEAKIRKSQSTFRLNGMRHYGACVISGTKISSVLDAAHIQPANGYNDHLSNCLILRKDLHKLFDDFELTIHPIDHEVVLSQDLNNEKVYQEYAGKKLKLCSDSKLLEAHFLTFKQRHA